MTDLRQAAEMALEALTLINQDLEKHRATLPIGRQPELCKASLVLRQAIAEAEKQEPVAWIVDGEIKVRLDMAGKLYYSETNVYATPVHASDISQERVDETAKRKHEFFCPRCGHCCREWVGLTDEEMKEAMEYWSDPVRSTYGGAKRADGEYVNMIDTWRYIEAKLKEKNT